MKTAKQWAEILRDEIADRQGFGSISDAEVWSVMTSAIEKIFNECQRDAMAEAYDRAAEAQRPG